MKFNFKFGGKTLLKASVFAISMAFAQAAFSTTLEQELAKAYKSNPQLLAAREALKAANQEHAKAISGYLPSSSLNFSNDRTTSDDRSFTNARGRDKDYYTNDTTARVTQSIFGGGETYYAVKAADERINAARFVLEKNEQEFLFLATQSYVELIHAKKVLDLSENNESVLKEQLAAVQERFNVGDATKTDVSQSEARYANATSARVVAEGEFISASALYKRYFQSELPEDMQMPSKLPNVPETLEAAIDTAKLKNYDVKISEFNKNSSEYEIKTARSPLLPQVDAVGSISDRSFVASGSKSNTQSQVIGLNVSIPLYDGGFNYASVRQARDRSNQAQYNLEATLIAVKNNVVDSWQSIITTDTNIQSTKKGLEASEVALKGVREEQKEGTRTILDVLDAEQEKFQAEVAHARAIKDSVLAVYRLKAVIGELIPAELNLPVAKYDQLEHYNQNKYKIIGF